MGLEEEGMPGQQSAEEFLPQLQTEAAELRAKNAELQTALSGSSFRAPQDASVMQYQLDSGEMLSKIEHFLKGEYIATDKEGNEFWAKQDKEDLILFNEYGVNSIMLILGNYIDRSTFLSFYTDEMRIYEILADFGDELASFIYCNYEKMGMNTEFKKTRYQITVITILHAVENAYRRAIRGQTSKDINSSQIFTQSDVLGGRRVMSAQKKAWYNPF